LESIRKAEDRELFKKTMQEIGEKVPLSTIATDLDSAVKFAEEVGFPSSYVRPIHWEAPAAVSP